VGGRYREQLLLLLQLQQGKGEVCVGCRQENMKKKASIEQGGEIVERIIWRRCQKERERKRGEERRERVNR
jgi:hypothetical protein